MFFVCKGTVWFGVATILACSTSNWANASGAARLHLSGEPLSPAHESAESAAHSDKASSVELFTALEQKDCPPPKFEVLYRTSGNYDMDLGKAGTNDCDNTVTVNANGEVSVSVDGPWSFGGTITQKQDGTTATITVALSGHGRLIDLAMLIDLCSGLVTFKDGAKINTTGNTGDTLDISGQKAQLSGDGTALSPFSFTAGEQTISWTTIPGSEIKVP